jgi:dTDP-4-dehydrorhamnose 3,5-epimerase
MNYLIKDTKFEEVKIIVPKIFEDDRGFFIEVFNKDVFDELGIPSDFVQLNHSRSNKGVVRGLHFQWDSPAGKLMRVTRGRAFLVAVDIRKNSLTCGEWYGHFLSEENKLQMWAPAGFARGFYSMEDNTEVQYLVTSTYNPYGEGEIKWNDPDIGIEWPASDPILSQKDKDAQSFKEWLDSENSKYLMYYGK